MLLVRLIEKFDLEFGFEKMFFNKFHFNIKRSMEIT